MKRTDFFRAVHHELKTNKKWSRSAWGRGVNAYVVDLLDNIESDDVLDNAQLLKKALLNGADNWRHFSEGGCSLFYNEDIAKRLGTPTELKKTRGGVLEPNKFETWLDVQARALFQAAARIVEVWHNVNA
jgi:hypothetical protein